MPALCPFPCLPSISPWCTPSPLTFPTSALPLRGPAHSCYPLHVLHEAEMDSTSDSVELIFFHVIAQHSYTPHQLAYAHGGEQLDFRHPKFSVITEALTCSVKPLPTLLCELAEQDAKCCKFHGILNCCKLSYSLWGSYELAYQIGSQAVTQMGR